MAKLLLQTQHAKKYVRQHKLKGKLIKTNAIPASNSNFRQPRYI